MNCKMVVILLILLTCNLQLAQGCCAADACDGRICNPPNCGDAEVEWPDACGCCTYCAKKIHEGEPCMPQIISIWEPEAVCERGTECWDNKCVSRDNIPLQKYPRNYSEKCKTL